jgi:signal transduction histidine kinase
VARSFSVGTKWALRNTVLLGVAAATVAIYGHLEIQSRITRDAQLFLELEVSELVEELRHGALNAQAVERSVAPEFAAAAAADPDHQVSLQVFDRSGELVYGRGRLLDEHVGLPENVFERVVKSNFDDLGLGESDPYWVVSAVASEGFVQVGISSYEFIASAGQLSRVFLAAAPAFLLLTAFLGWWIARLSLRPINQITEVARRISFAQLDQRIPVSGNQDELDRLAETLNEMISRLEQGVGSLQRFTEDAAHQLRTPLARLRSRLEDVLGEKGAAIPETVVNAITQSLEEVENVPQSITATLQLAESEAGLRAEQLAQIPLRKLLSEIVEFYEPLARERGIELKLDAGDDVLIRGTVIWLQQMFSNLLNNALQHTRDRIDVELDVVGPSSAVVRIKDNGSGIGPDEIPRIFDRFFRGNVATGKPGAGLGLAIARQMARAHGGDIHVESGRIRGSVFSVILPRSQKATDG